MLQALREGPFAVLIQFKKASSAELSLLSGIFSKTEQKLIALISLHVHHQKFSLFSVPGVHFN